MTSSSSGGNGGDPWAWLGLLKWSLSYTDGTRDSSETMQPMSEEDRIFLETVMSEGIIDENKRMKYILEQVAMAMDYYQEMVKVGAHREDGNNHNNNNKPPPKKAMDGNCPVPENDLLNLLSELQDIVEQIDFARAFCSLKGLPFLLGCIADEEQAIPESIRFACLSIIATLCQNNPPVQQQLLELGSLKNFSDVYFQYMTTATSKKFPAKIMQVISANVRNHPVAESVFTQLEQSPELIMTGLNADSTVSSQLQSRTLFFLRALVTSDSHHGSGGGSGSGSGSSNDDGEAVANDNHNKDDPHFHLERFQSAVATVMDQYILLGNTTTTTTTPQKQEEEGDANVTTTTTTAAAAALPVSPDLIEMALGLVDQLLQQYQQREGTTSSLSPMIPVIVQRKPSLEEMGRKRLQTLEQLTGEDRDFAQVELEHWQSILKLLSKLPYPETTTTTPQSTASLSSSETKKKKQQPVPPLTTLEVLDP